MVNVKSPEDTQRAQPLQSRHPESADGAPWSPLPGVRLGPRHVGELLGPLLHQLLLKRLRYEAATNFPQRAGRAA